jgi:aspartate aminotransferase-like enzyme
LSGGSFSGKGLQFPAGCGILSFVNDHWSFISESKSDVEFNLLSLHSPEDFIGF